MEQAVVPEFEGLGYEIYEWRHASAILRADFPEEWADICQVLGNLSAGLTGAAAQ